MAPGHTPPGAIFRNLFSILHMRKITFCIALLLSLVLTSYAVDKNTISSPDGKIQLSIFVVNNQLSYAVSLKGVLVVESSPIKMTVDGKSITGNVSLGKIDKYELNETYPWYGAHAKAVNHFKGEKIEVRNKTDQQVFTFEVRAFNDGAAFRIIVPGKAGEKRTPDEATLFKIPAGSTVWYHDLNGHYESVYQQKGLAEIKANEWAGPPLTYRLPDHKGYVAITEANLVNYSGMALQADGKGSFAIGLAHNQPTSHPYKLRYTPADTLRLRKAAVVTGDIATPWRVVMVGTDLNAMVNNDMVHNLCPPPDKTLFPEGILTDWIKPGRAVWRYLDTPEGEESTSEVLAKYSKEAGELGFQYNILEGFWSRWTDDQIRELVKYSKERGVGIWFWKHSKSLWDDKERQAFFKRCHDLGVVGVKLDFFDHEHKEVVDFYHTILKETAQNKLLVDFHGSNKPTGDSRTWPNELTRESVKGMETRALEDRATHHVTIPFTRWLAGPAEYTPVHFDEIRRRNTSAVHQVASAAILSAPLLTYSANPEKLLASPAAGIIKAIPSVWDETVVLPGSEIGELAAYARRKGDKWFICVMNGTKARSLKIDLNFLTATVYKATEIKDVAGDPMGMKITQSDLKRGTALQLDLAAGGGYIAELVK